MTFDVDGVATVDIQPGAQTSYELDEAMRVELLPNGKLLLGGQIFVNGNWRFTPAQLNAGGTPDTTFGDDGRVITALGAGDSMLYHLSVAPDGKIVAGGYRGSAGNTGDRKIGAARYNPNGTLDTTFGTGGVFLLPQAGFTGDELRGVLALPGGQVLLAGGRSASGVIIRLTNAGTLDPTFGTNGIRTDAGTPCTPPSLKTARAASSLAVEERRSRGCSRMVRTTLRSPASPSAAAGATGRPTSPWQPRVASSPRPADGSPASLAIQRFRFRCATLRPSPTCARGRRA